MAKDLGLFSDFSITLQRSHGCILAHTFKGSALLGCFWLRGAKRPCGSWDQSVLPPACHGRADPALLSM